MSFRSYILINYIIFLLIFIGPHYYDHYWGDWIHGRGSVAWRNLVVYRSHFPSALRSLLSFKFLRPETAPFLIRSFRLGPARPFWLAQLSSVLRLLFPSSSPSLPRPSYYLLPQSLQPPSKCRSTSTSLFSPPPPTLLILFDSTATFLHLVLLFSFRILGIADISTPTLFDLTTLDLQVFPPFRITHLMRVDFFIILGRLLQDSNPP